MLAATFSATTNAAVIIAVGAVTTLMAFGILPASLDARKAKQWHGRWGSKAKLGGPLIMVVGVVLLARAWLQS